VVADHGESLGEHGLLNHLYGLYEPLTRVPLVMRGPGIPRRAEVVDLTQTHDLFGTLLAAAGAPLPDNARNLFDGSTPRSYVVAEYGQPRVPHLDLLNRFSLQAADFAPFMRGLVAVRTERHKLIVGSDGAMELYDLVENPAESINRAQDSPQVMADMQRLLAEWRSTTGLAPAQPPALPTPPAIPPEVAARLKALGYLD
jgi:arylsulfatase A-like enzyme